VRENLLTIMVGPSGAGKTRYSKHMQGYVSSDDLRGEYCGGDFSAQDRNEDVFTALDRIAKARLDSGLPVCIDATNLRRRDRLARVALAPAGTTVRYVVVDRPLAAKLADRGWRPAWLVEKYHERMQSALRDILAGDGLPHVVVEDLRIQERVAA